MKGTKIAIKPVAVARNREGRIIWLEEEDFFHILDRHPDRFKIFGTEYNSENPEAIGNLIFYAITKYPIVRSEPGRAPGATMYVYKVRRPGGEGYLWVLVDQDGHIVTSYTTRKLSSSQY